MDAKLWKLQNPISECLPILMDIWKGAKAESV